MTASRSSDRSAKRVRTYGSSGPLLLLLHGGPGAPGYLGTVASELADSFRVLEPFQRGSGSESLTVNRHVADLHEMVSACREKPLAMIGHSWGAMLALAYGAAHPDGVASLVLVGCGTFDRASRNQMRTIEEQRMDDGLRRRLNGLAEEVPDRNERLRMLGNLLLPLYSYEPTVHELPVEVCDARAHDESWNDMVRLQEEGEYPAAFAAIKAPVIMLHGAVDPHPGRLIFASLRTHLPQLEYREWERCGHYPWLEKAAREEFFASMHQWLTRQGGR